MLKRITKKVLPLRKSGQSITEKLFSFQKIFFVKNSKILPPNPQSILDIKTKIGSLTLGEERSLARLWWEGNPPEEDERRRTCPCEIRDDAMIVQGYPKFIDKSWRWKYKGNFRFPAYHILY